MTTATDSPGGAPQPADDQEEQVQDFGPPEIVEEQEEQREGLPLGHLMVGGLSVLGVGGAVLFAAFGVAGLVGGALVPVAGAVAYVRHRRDRRGGGRPSQASGWGWGTPRTGGRGRGGSGSAGSWLPGLGGRSRTGGKGGGAGRSGPGRTGRGSGSGRRGGAGSALRMPSLPGLPRLGGGRGAGKAAGGGKTGTGSGSGGGSGRPGGGRTGSAASGGSGAKAGGKGGGKGGSRSAGTGGARTKAGPVARAARKVKGAAKAADAKTGHRASRAASKAGRWVDARTGGRAGRAARSTRKAWKRSAPYRRTASVGLLAGVAAMAAITAPAWAVVSAGAAALAGGLAWRRRKRRKAKTTTESTTQAGQGAADEEPIPTPQPGAESAGKARRCTWCGREISGGDVREHVIHGWPMTVCPPCFTAYEQRKQAESRTWADRPDPFAPFTTTARSMPMSGFPLATIAAEMNVVASRHTPVDMWQVARELDQLRDVPINVALAIRTYTAHLQSEYPISPVVTEQIFQLYKGLAQLTQQAEEIAVTFRKVHDKDLVREEAPRTNEKAWNVR